MMLRFSSKCLTSTSVASRQAVRMTAAAPMCVRRWYTTEPLPTPGSATVDPKISAIVDQIEGLTLLQTSELVSQLKTRLNIQDIAMPVAMPTGGAAAPAAAAAEEEKPAEKTEFSIKIDKVDAAAKAKVIREVKNLAGLNLVEAKKFVESVPKVLKESVPKEEAEKLKKALEAVGASVSLE
ncbi:ribosomal protein L7/L12 C-terminal domain-containing protein [Gilbertella persicaria]|uniref:ribosomal protein L7/L12 C-terminal domain-containing protein n=1 Tax=Gilbertella persicaria TaxID=101096 RepID=UPI00221F3095|nr:ribosomal protein L7/L12 C-terminal domain-containing protein [Gilbertella persicaria]KAI8070562.1 ribosomal protein L7/L12 C-terminal domain-containing protein [Gilbertella persicaria]